LSEDTIDNMSRDVKRALIVVPAFNEEASVGDVVREVFSKVPGAHVLVVDDGSNDGTSQQAREAGAVVATLPFNLGVGGAMRLGFRYALENRYDYVVQIDADGQHDPASVTAMLHELSHADLVLGARFAGQGDYKVHGPRRWAMATLSTVLSRIAHTQLTDTTSGFRASGPRAISVFARQYPAEYLGDTIETLVIAARTGLAIRQIPVSMRPRSGGVPSQHPIKAAVYLGRAGLALVFALIRPSSTFLGHR
jgi:glycosyltransferase involved in cell wall biosynthesis